MAENWYVFYVRPKFEKKIQKELSRSGIESYLPLVETLRHWHDRKKKLLLPVFPCYIFVKVASYELHEMFLIPGFVRVVSKENQPEILSEEEINNLRIILSGDFEVLDEDICSGDRVRISTGALAGVEGVLIERKGRSQFVIFISQIGKYVTVNADKNCIEKCDLIHA